jgi:hypothetical protein
MKKTMSTGVLFTMLTLLPSATFAQTLKDFFVKTYIPAIWLGMDFTQTRIINDPTATASAFVSQTFSAINELTVKEAKKYDVQDAFRRWTMDHDFTAVTNGIAAIDQGKLISSNPADAARLKDADVKAVVSRMDFGGKKGPGILFVVEAFDKTEKKVCIWVTLVDMGSKSVLATERVEGKTGNGFGERNYWASGIKSIIDEIKKHKYDEWKSKS